MAQVGMGIDNISSDSAYRPDSLTIPEKFSVWKKVGLHKFSVSTQLLYYLYYYILFFLTMTFHADEYIKHN